MPDKATKPIRALGSFRGAALDYVDTQLAIMRKYGSDPKLSKGEYFGLVEEIEQIGIKLWTDSGGQIV